MINLLDALVAAGWLGAIAIAVIVIGILAVAFCAVLLIHHTVSSRRRRRRAEGVRRASAALAPHLISGQGLPDASRTAAQEWGAVVTAEVLRQARGELRGSKSDTISAVLGEIGEVERLRRLARARSIRRRLQGIRGLGECGGIEAREVLVEATKHPDPEVRRAARDGLLSARDVESIRVAVRSYLEDYPSLAGWRGTFYGRLAAVAPDQLTELVQGGELTPMQEKLALEALGDAHHGSVREFARTRLDSEHPELRATAARVVGKLRDGASAPRLLELLRDEEWFVRAASARGLERLQVRPADLAQLAEALRDPVWWVRANAAAALSRQGEPGVDALIEAVEGDDSYARDAALSALAYVAPAPAVLERLRRVWHHLQDHTRTALAGALSMREEAAP